MEIKGSLSGKNIATEQQKILGVCIEKGADENLCPALAIASS